MRVAVSFQQRRANPKATLKAHWEMQYRQGAGTDTDKNVKEVTDHLVEILEAPHSLTQLKGDDRIARLRHEMIVQGKMKGGGEPS